MKIKTSKLMGPALDWAVAQCEEKWTTVASFGIGPEITHIVLGTSKVIYSPSTNWAQGGPISERGGIWAHTTNEGVEDPSCLWRAELPYIAVEVGPTELIAKMRCFVASKLGDSVEIPDELLKA